MRTPKNATERLAARYIPKGATPVLEHENGSALYTYELAGKPLYIAFWGTSAKAYAHYSCRSIEARNAAIWQFREKVEASLNFRNEQKAARKTGHTLKVGDILNTSWGYDQTNVDFFVVTRISAARVWVRRIVKEYEETGFMSGQSWPAMPIQMVGEESMHVAHGSSCSIKGHHASLSEGRTHYESSYA
jgi:hypothetical protein